MRLHVTKRAATQIERALDYIEAESPQGANRMRERIQALFHLLAEHPYAGQATDLPGVRRLSVSPYPYLTLLPRHRRRGYRSAHPPHIAPAALRVRRAMMVLGFAGTDTATPQGRLMLSAWSGLDRAGFRGDLPRGRSGPEADTIFQV